MAKRYVNVGRQDYQVQTVAESAANLRVNGMAPDVANYAAEAHATVGARKPGEAFSGSEPVSAVLPQAVNSEWSNYFRSPKHTR